MVLTFAALSFKHLPCTYLACAVWRKTLTDLAGAALVQPPEGRALLSVTVTVAEAGNHIAVTLFRPI